MLSSFCFCRDRLLLYQKAFNHSEGTPKKETCAASFSWVCSQALQKTSDALGKIYQLLVAQPGSVTLETQGSVFSGLRRAVLVRFYSSCACSPRTLLALRVGACCKACTLLRAGFSTPPQWCLSSKLWSGMPLDALPSVFQTRTYINPFLAGGSPCISSLKQLRITASPKPLTTFLNCLGIRGEAVCSLCQTTPQR